MRRLFQRRMADVDAMDRAIAGGIAVFALAAVVWAGAEFVDAGQDPPVLVVSGAAAAELALERVPLHRLMPEAADDVGRRVLVDGTVAAAAGTGGIWVRDLRGYTIYVSKAEGVDLWALEVGDPVRIRGRVALLPAGTARDRLGRVEHALDAGALLVRGVMIVPQAGGLDALTP